MTKAPELKTCPTGGIMFAINNYANEFVIVDEEDAYLASEHKWCKSRSDRYVRCWNGNRMISIHRLIMNAPDGSAVDHMNGDTLDNRRANLRICAQAQNIKNRKPNKNGKSAYKGVVILKNGRFRAKIDNDGKRYQLGVYDTEREAAVAYNAACKVLHGEFAYMNELPEWNTRADLSPSPEAFQQMREALEEISKQKKTDELETEYDVDIADFEAGYDMCIDRARAALKAAEGE